MGRIVNSNYSPLVRAFPSFSRAHCFRNILEEGYSPEALGWQEGGSAYRACAGRTYRLSDGIRGISLARSLARSVRAEFGQKVSVRLTMCESKPSNIHKPLFYRHFSLIPGLAPSFIARERRKLLRFCCRIPRAFRADQTFVLTQVTY